MTCMFVFSVFYSDFGGVRVLTLSAFFWVLRVGSRGNLDREDGSRGCYGDGDSQTRVLKGNRSRSMIGFKRDGRNMY
ncbi:unnamed protein product [Linum tenue]|uniref:Secreted protein n=1 Tax=Linum tenue TaxID=586396 RepID=A0AAV0LJG5_9ROSI|nr:unnamed protein product [Linum tenue]